jgi:proteasome lid subunit RPN8/RPN11
MLTITKTDLQKIYEHCDREYPNEACGILAGHDGWVEKNYQMTNAKPSPGYYEMDTEEQFQVMKDIRQGGLEMIGIYHSHTGGPAYPSSVDVEKAYWPGTLYPNYPGALYLIVTLMDRKNPAARAFKISENKRISEVEVKVVPEEDGR